MGTSPIAALHACGHIIYLRSTERDPDMVFSNLADLKRIAILTLAQAAFGGALFAQNSNELGEIDFATSGKPAALASFNRGLQALHSFWFPEAIRNFKEAEQRDPQFVMAYWGQAFSYHWSLQGIEQVDSARAVLAYIDNLLASAAPRRHENELISTPCAHFSGTAARANAASHTQPP